MVFNWFGADALNTRLDRIADGVESVSSNLGMVVDRLSCQCQTSTQLDAIITDLASIKSEQSRQSELLKVILKVLLRVELRSVPSGPITVTPNSEVTGEEMDKIVFDVSLPSLPLPNDVVTRLLTVGIDGSSTTVEVPATTTTVRGYSAPQDSTVVLTLVDVDDSGNKSPASTFQFVAVDSFAPAVPGTLGVVIVGEDLGGVETSPSV